MGRIKPKIILDKYDFKLQRNNGDITYWICATYNKTKCKCRLKTTRNVVYVSNRHSHDPKDLNLADFSFRDVVIIKKNQY